MKTTNKKISEIVCRLCLCKIEQTNSTESQSENKNFEETKQMLQEIFHIEIDDLVLSIANKTQLYSVCCLCDEKLLNSYHFYHTVLKSQELLKNENIIETDDLKKLNAQNLENESFASPSDFGEIKIETLDVNDEEIYVLDPSKQIDEKDEDLGPRTRRKLRAKKSINTLKTKATKKSVKLLQEKDPEEQVISKKSTYNLVSKQEKAEEDQRIQEFFSLSCTKCSEPFGTFGGYRAHMIETHKIQRPAILCCKKRFTKRCRLLEHLIFHVNPEEYQCNACGRQCLNKFRLEQHRLQHHSSLESRKYQCDKCFKRFLIPANLKAHLLTHLSQEEKDRLKTYFCHECGNSYSSKYLIEQHIRKIHLKVYAFVCDICAKPFKTKNDFLYHYSHIHATVKEPKVQCTVCSAWLTNERCLKTHFRRIHANPGPHICNVCGKVSPTSEALRSHQRYVHEAQRKFQCTYCDKAFKKEVNLKEHMTTHLGGVLYTCCFCDKTFNSGANMYSHRKKKHPVENEKLVQESRNEKLGLNKTDN